MITKEQALTLRHGQILRHLTAKNADGTPLRARVTGKCKTWVTRPEEFQLPVKYGLRDCFYITDDTAHAWEIAE
jgi:hypothetical protein